MERAGQHVLEAEEQRCWNHSVADVLVRVPKQRDGEALGVTDREPVSGPVSAGRSKIGACIRNGS